MALLLAAAIDSSSSWGRIAINEIDQLSAVGIGVAVPTSMMTVREVEQLNLPVWAASSLQASVSASESVDPSDPAAAQHVCGSIRRLVDPDLAVHACLMESRTCSISTLCNISVSSTEDKNRYLDLCLVHQSLYSVRIVLTEDAARAVNRPLAFNVRIDSWNVDGHQVAREQIGMNLTPLAAGKQLDAQGLDWARDSWLRAAVSTTSHWPWQPCTPRRARSLTTAGGTPFQDAIKSAIVGVLAGAVGNWSVTLGPLKQQNRTGIAVSIEYTLCGHLMYIPVAVEHS